MVIGMIGATIAPWMQFYLQASVVEKGVTPKEYAGTRLDVLVGSIFTDVVAWFKNQTTSDEGYQTRIDRARREHRIAWTFRAVAFSDVLAPLGKEIARDRAKSCGGAPYGNRTRVSAVKGRRPGPLDEGR